MLAHFHSLNKQKFQVISYSVLINLTISIEMKVAVAERGFHTKRKLEML